MLFRSGHPRYKLKILDKKLGGFLELVRWSDTGEGSSSSKLKENSIF